MADTVKAVVVYDAVGFRLPDEPRTQYADLGDEVDLPKDEFERLGDAVAKAGSDEAKDAMRRREEQNRARFSVAVTAPDQNLPQPGDPEWVARRQQETAERARAESGGDYESMSVSELDALADAQGMADYPASGKKADKIKALKATDAAFEDAQAAGKKDAHGERGLDAEHGGHADPGAPPAESPGGRAAVAEHETSSQRKG